jgi:DNA (cytosine-5)-methyltransferase 1
VQYTFVDLFAGIGGTRLAFEKNGMRCVFSSEIDKFARGTYKANFLEEPFGDITEIEAHQIPKHNVLIAGFPCQSFSHAGLKLGLKDKRGALFFEIVRILEELKPDCFLLENVKRLKGHDNGKTFKLITEYLSGTLKDIPKELAVSNSTKSKLKNNLKYWLETRVLNTKDFGLPQNRERIFIVGFNLEKYKKQDLENFFNWPKIKKVKTEVEQILEENVGDKYTISEKLWNGHIKRKKAKQKKGHGFGYKLVNNKSSYTSTLSARYYKDGSEILIDQSDINRRPRKLTPRECGNLQGFPKRYKLNASSNMQLYKQLGNSVSIPVVNAIAKQIKITLDRVNEKKN